MEKMKVLVCVDVWNCQPRAFLTDDFLPTAEIARIAWIESGKKIPEYKEDIYDILSEKDKKRVDKIAEPINISGIRGTIEVDLDEKQLMLFLLQKKEEELQELKEKIEKVDEEKNKNSNFAYSMAKAILRGMSRSGLEKIAKKYTEYMIETSLSVSPLDWNKIWTEDRKKKKFECGDIIQIDGKKGCVLSDNGKDMSVHWGDGSESTISVFQPHAKLLGFSEYE